MTRTNARSCRTRLPWFLEFGWSGFGPVFRPSMLSVFVFAPSAAGVEGIERATPGVPGVLGAEANVLVRVFSFPDAFEPLLASLALAPSRRGPPSPAPAPRAGTSSGRARRRSGAPSRSR